MTINYNNKLLSFKKPLVMGILNATPDSFYSASRVADERTMLLQIEQMIDQGVDILDIGAYSSRPSAENIEEQEEINRLSGVLKPIVKHFPNLALSVDTFRASVATHVVTNFGVGIINDIGGGTLDPTMFETIAQLKVAYVLMHMRGTPQTMQQACNYTNLVVDITSNLQQKVHALRLLGIKDVIIDPGFGFAKTLDQNYKLLQHLALFQQIGAPILAGVSRKSMIYKLLDLTANEALNGTTALHMAVLLQGASILRAHDVKEAREVISIFEQIRT